MAAIEVWTAADLNNVRNNLAGDYIQMADVDLAGYNWLPIGEYRKGSTGWQGAVFTGSYDGNGFKITNLSIAIPAGDFIQLAGLFGDCQNATFRNVILEGVNISCGDWGGMVAGLVGRISGGAVQDCRVLSGTIAGDDNVGGLIGYADSFSNPVTVERCSASVALTGFYCVGGLIGIFEYGGTVSQCYATGNVEIVNEGYWAGGLIGMVFDSGTVQNCYARGDITGVFSSFGSEAGGLVGGSDDGIISCYSTGLVAPSDGGGLCAYGTVTACYYDTQTSGQSDTGKGEPRTTAEMTHPEDFTTTFIGWDFASIWAHDPGYTINNGYPPLKWQIPVPVANVFATRLLRSAITNKAVLPFAQSHALAVAVGLVVPLAAVLVIYKFRFRLRPWCYLGLGFVLLTKVAVLGNHVLWLAPYLGD